MAQPDRGSHIYAVEQGTRVGWLQHGNLPLRIMFGRAPPVEQMPDRGEPLLDDRAESVCACVSRQGHVQRLHIA
jgi:hypothetical protein